MSYVVVSYYTKDTPYEKDAAFLKKSCIRLGLKHDIQPIANLGAWDKNCAYKPDFLLKMLDKHQQDVVWTDADSFFLKHPFYFDTPNYDLALKIYSDLPNSSIHKMVSATMYLKNCNKIKLLLKNWSKGCIRKKPLIPKTESLFDQAVLKDILLKTKHTVDYKPLPFSHCKVFDSDLDHELDAKNIILHTQGSRSNHNTIVHDLCSSLLNTFSIESLWNLRDYRNFGIETLLEAKKTIDNDSQ